MMFFDYAHPGCISIHALLAESDFGFCDLEPIRNPISIHALLAESDSVLLNNQQRHIQFLSTLSLRRATPDGTTTATFFGISIHALLAESDTVPRGGHIIYTDFYPRSPCGERL